MAAKPQYGQGYEVQAVHSDGEPAGINTEVTIFPSAARTASATGDDQTNHHCRGLHLFINATAASATPSVTFTIQGKDAVSGTYYTILASSAITGVSTTVLKVFPGSAVAANATANDILPKTWRVIATAGDSDSLTYSVGASLVL